MRNVLLVAIDSLRPDHLGCYGYARPTSPRLDAFAAGADLLSACWSASNFTAPAFTSLFTGLHPNHHGVFDFGARVAVSPVHAALRAAGVRMGGVVTFRFLRRLLADIWGPIEAVTDTRSTDHAIDLPRAVTDGGLEWLARHGREGPFALFLHYNGPHVPFRLPPEHQGRFGPLDPPGVDPELHHLLFPRDGGKRDTRAADQRIFAAHRRIERGRKRVDEATLRWIVDRYDESVFYNDEQVGRLLAGLDELGLADQTVVAVISDHGEELLDHGFLGHGGIHLYEEVVRTLALVRDPAAPAAAGGPRRSRRPCSHVQLLPWLLRLAGVPGLPPAWQQLDLRDEGVREPVFCVGEFKSAVRLGERKYVRQRVLPSHSRIKRLRLLAKLLLVRRWGDELYDLASDPGERRNLLRAPGPAVAAGLARPAAPAAAPPSASELRRLLAAHLASGVADLGGSGREGLSAEEKARLEQEMRDLGYM